MSVNENKEFETINQKVMERTFDEEEVRQSAANAYREVRTKKKLRAIAAISFVVFFAAVAATGFWGLEQIEWINHTFSVVLTAVAFAVASFKVGCIWTRFSK